MTSIEPNALNIQRAVSLEFLKNSGGFAVKANPKSKSPASGWDPKLNSQHKSDILINQLEHTDDNLGVHLHGALVDVDIDSDAPFLMDALETFLPPCSHVWGRTSRPRTHRVYMLKDDEAFDPAAYPFLKRMQRIDECKVEVRGGPITRGEYSLLPGSIHPDGDVYEWADLSRARNSISAVTADRLLSALRMAGAAAVIAPYWQEGIRNDLVMALAGFLHRAHSIAANLDVGTFALDREASRSFLESFLKIAGDDTGDEYSRLKTFERTWDKADKGVPTTGASTIARLLEDEHIVRKLYTLLTSSPDIAAIDEFVERFAIWQGPGVVVDMMAADSGSNRPIMTRQQFCNSWGHKFITVGEKQRLLADMLFSYSSTRRVSGLTFEPGKSRMVETKEGTKINQWTSFAIPPSDAPVTADEVEPFVSYIFEVLADEKQEVFDWVMSWLAHIFQEPANKSKTALVLVGLPGAGKSILGHEIIMPIIGENHSASTNAVESITKDFNVAFDNKIYVQCDEATNSRQKSIAAKLKSLITDPYKMVEPKGIDAFMKPNHIRFVFTSNDIEDALYLNDGLDDRRYTVLEVSAKYKDQVKEYWEPFVEWLHVEENLAKIHRYLVDYAYQRSVIQRPLNTEAKANMQQRSWEPFDAWLASWLARGHPLHENNHDYWHDAPIGDKKELDRSDWPTEISLAALSRDYNWFLRYYGHRYGHPLNEVQISKEFKRRGFALDTDSARKIRVTEFDEKKKKNITKRIRLYVSPMREDVEKWLRRKYNLDMMLKDIKDNEGTAEQTNDELEF